MHVSTFAHALVMMKMPALTTHAVHTTAGIESEAVMKQYSKQHVHLAVAAYADLNLATAVPLMIDIL
jgi:hypothetical protein